MQNQSKAKTIAYGAMVGAAYAVCGSLLAPIGFGTLQVRVSEALTLLPVFHPVMVVGVTVGCAITNLVGFLTGMSIIGPLDILFGTLATLVAACLTYLLRDVRFRGAPVLASLPPVILNAVVVGAELTFVIGDGFSLPIFCVQALSVGAGQLLACCGLGLPLVYLLEKKGIATRLFGAKR